MPTRTELVFDACNRIAAQALKTGQVNVRPTARSVREQFEVQGSLTDIQADIHHWFMRVFERHLDAGRVPGIPEALVGEVDRLWRLALAEAEQTLAGERLAMGESIRASDEARAAAERARQDALREQLATEQKLAVTAEALTRLERQLSELSATLAGKDERVQALNDTISHLTESHGAELARLRAETAQHLEELDGARKYALMQVEDARALARRQQEALEKLQADSADLVDSMRNRAFRAEAEAAAVRARLEAVEARVADAEALRNQALVEAALQTRESERLASRIEPLESALALLREKEARWSAGDELDRALRFSTFIAGLDRARFDTLLGRNGAAPSDRDALWTAFSQNRFAFAADRRSLFAAAFDS